MQRRPNVKPGVFQLRVLGAVATADAPMTPLDVCHALDLHSSATKRVNLALDRLLRLGYVTEDYPSGRAVYTITDEGRAAC